MEPTQTGEDQPEEGKKQPPVEGGGSGSATETDALKLENAENEMASTEAKETEENEAPGNARTEEMGTLEEALEALEDDSVEDTYVIESSPEKQPSEKTKEDSVTSPTEEVVSIDDEEETEERLDDEEEDEEEDDEEEEEEEEEEYGDIDENDEIYVEPTDSVDANELSEENSPASDISSDEYTDDEVDQGRNVAQKGGKSMPPEDREPSNEQDVIDGDDVLILNDDDVVEEEKDSESDQEEEEEEEDGDVLDITAGPESFAIKSDPKDGSDSSEPMEKDPSVKVKHRNYQYKLADSRMKVKYRNYQHKLADLRMKAKYRNSQHKLANLTVKGKYRNLQHKRAALLLKRSKILQRQSMHVMEDSSDALVVCSDTNLTTNLKQALPSPPKEDAPEPLSVAKPSLENPEIIVQTTSITTTTSNNSSTGIDRSQPNQTKELDPSVKIGKGERESAQDTEGEELSRDAISSTSDNKMPTATACEVVSEKIADSSDDALTAVVISSKKPISAATTPLGNSAVTSAEPGEGKAKESNNADTTLEDVSKESTAVEEVAEKPKHGKDVAAPGEAMHSPNTVEGNEPTADDVMEGIDDFMDHNESDGQETNGRDEDGFNEDLAFQMDVDESPKETVTSEKPELTDGGKNDKKLSVEVRKGTEESAMDLTSSPEPQPSTKQDYPVAEKEVISNATTSINATTTNKTSSVSLVDDVVDSSPEKCNQRGPSLATQERDRSMRDKTIVTSTPIALGGGAEKRTESVQRPVSHEEERHVAQVKLEVSEEPRSRSVDTDEHRNEVQNLSTAAKPSSEARRSSVSDEPASVPPVQTTATTTANRKRRRSVDRADGPETDAEPEEPIEPAKKLKLEVEANYQTHERVVNEYIDTTPNTSVDEIQSHTDTLVKEIQNLNEMIRDTEKQWNNLLHMKKVKEEILLRLNRKKHVIGITQTPLGEVSAFNHLDSSNLSSHQQLNPHHPQQQQRSSSVGPRPPTPPPEVEIRPASVSTTMNYSHNASNGVGVAGGKHSQISNRRNSSIAAAGGSSHSNTNHNSSTGGKRFAKDTNSFVSQFNSSNNAVTMVPLNPTSDLIVQARASMNSAEIAKEKAIALQVQRQLFPKPVLSNQQQILNNLAMSAGLTSLGTGANNNNSNNTSVRVHGELQTLQAQLQAALLANNNLLLAGIKSQALLNGHHGPSAGGTTREQQQQQQLQIGRQGKRKDVTSIIADYRQQHPESVPRRGRRMKHVGGSGSNNGGMSTGSSFGEGSAISLTALPGGKSTAMGRSSSTDNAANRLSELLAAAENSRPSSNDSSQSSSNLLSSLVSASGGNSSSQQQFLKDVLVQFAKMSQNEQSLLSNLQLLANNAALASTGPSTATTNTVSSPQQSPQFQQQHHQQTLPQLHASLLSKASLPEVTLHPVMNSTTHSDILGSHNSTGTLSGANLSAVNTSTNSLLHGILTKSASRPGAASAAASGATAAAVAANTYNSFSPTLARLLTGPERMNIQSASSSTVTSGALANLQTGGVIGGLNLSKNNSEISITPVVGSNYQQTLLAQQQQQQQLQRLREQHLFKGDSYLNIDDEADDSVDRLVIDEGDDMGSHRDAISKRRVAEINENEVPQCQGCKKMEAKFVCAGCNHQWYCSRECQVSAWDDHSEVCSG